MSHITQSEFLREYNDSHRNQFNQEFFIRDNQEIMDCVKKVVLSCEKDRYFTLKVVSMREVYDYEEVRNILRQYAESRRKSNKKKFENIYDYIDIEDSDLMLLVVNYFVRHNGVEKQEVPNPDGNGKVVVDVKDPYQELTVLIALPRFVHKYYFRLNGNYYTSTFQIVDGSTYNNSNTGGGSNGKKVECNTFKTLFMPVRIYKRYRDLLDVNTKKTIRSIVYGSNIFNNFIDCMLYILANYGLYGTFKFLDINCIYLDDHPYNQINGTGNVWFSFCKRDIYINVPVECFEQDPMIQSLVATIYNNITKDTRLNDLFNIRYWIGQLGYAYKGNTNPIDKGLFILDSVDSIYDIITYEELHLPENMKGNIYQILRWLMREFTPLKNKDNVDVTLKRVRIAEYVAAIYANKLSKGIHRISDAGKRVTLARVIQAVRTDPMYVVNNIINMSNLVSYVDLVNDNDAALALKYTYKGISGLGEDGTSIQRGYRYVDPSHAGILDLDTSSASDPGMSGMICPMTNLYNRSSFTQYQEPNTWPQQYKPIQDQWFKKQNPNAKEALVWEDGPRKNEYNYEGLRDQVIQDSLQIDKMRCPIFNILDPSVDYSRTASITNQQESKPNSLFGEEVPSLFKINTEDNTNNTQEGNDNNEQQQ